jgi:hypothetical protein
MENKIRFKKSPNSSEPHSYGRGLRSLLENPALRWKRVDHREGNLPSERASQPVGLTKSEEQAMANNGEFRKGSSEQEYFFRLNKELTEKFKAKTEQRKQQHDDQVAKELHWMKCPRCGHDLKSQDFGSLMVDQCGDCGGVFLDKSEVDFLMDLQDHNSLSTIFNGLMSPKKKGA